MINHMVARVNVITKECMSNNECATLTRSTVSFGANISAPQCAMMLALVVSTMHCQPLRMIKVDEHSTTIVVHHDVISFHITMCDPFAVTVGNCYQNILAMSVQWSYVW